jgi:carboxyl-terminal processing protease
MDKSGGIFAELIADGSKRVKYMMQRLFVGASTVVLSMFLLSGTPYGPSQANATTEEGLQTFTQILSLVEDNYVEEVDSKVLVYGAIRGMLGRLDPHSSFLDPDSYKDMQEEQRGSFSGLGIVISLRGDHKDLTVISPIDGTPAYRAGIRAGDVISQIEKETTAGISINDALKKLRGPKGSRVNIGITREGDDETLDFSLIRDDIPTSSIPYAFMLEPEVGYIRIKNFTQTTTRELDEKIAALTKQGMTKMILDLRWNPGGLLDQAVKISDKFLKPSDMIVYTKGRARESYQAFRSRRGGSGQPLPLVILVNKGSASASEIVAGAIQDHDRGIIVGETTWGKGLVQTVYRLSQHAGVALTTAKYYTPSGRLIQRPFDEGHLDDYYAGRLTTADEERETKYTASGRKVLGGGGISPDVEVSLEEATKFEQRMERKSIFFDYAVKYIAENSAISRTEFKVDNVLLADFRKFVEQKKIEFTGEEWTESLGYSSTMIKAEIFGALYGLEERQKIIAKRDRQILRALEVLPAAENIPIVQVDLDGLKPATTETEPGDTARKADTESQEPLNQ